MGSLHRFQTLFDAEQHLFVPDSPVWVSRCRLSLDPDRGIRFLQLRMVNCSEKTIRRVFLRVTCYNAAGSRLSRLEMLPLPPSEVLPGRIFGDGLAVRIAQPGAVRVEAFAQRVLFADGTAWDELRPEDALAYAPPEPLRQDDPADDALRLAAAREGLRCAYRYRRQAGVWTCVCGVPNGSRSLRCARCGADRLLLERLAEEPCPVPEQPSRPREEGRQPVFVSEDPAREPVMITEAPEFTPAVQPLRRSSSARDARERSEAGAGEEDGAENSLPAELMPDRHGRRMALAMAALILLALGAFCAYQFLMPWLRYRKAVRAQENGNEVLAAAIFTELGDYRDSALRLSAAAAGRGVGLMEQGRYEEALELFASMPDYASYAADCLYALGVQAYNEGDPELASSYADRLEEAYPDCDKLPLLRQYCDYAWGNRFAAEAAEVQVPSRKLSLYESAVARFRSADCADSAERVTECLYRIACIHMENGELLRPIREFREIEPYRDALDLRLQCMYDYVLLHLTYQDETAMAFLTELADYGNPDAQAILSRLNGEGFDFRVSLPHPDWSDDVVTDLGQVRIDYSIDAVADDGSDILISLICSMPDGRSYRANLNPDGSSSGSVTWAELELPTICEAEGELVISFYDPGLGVGDNPIYTYTFWFAPGNNEPTDVRDKTIVYGG